jgi:hypothetical protein
MKASRRQFIILSATGLAAATAGQTFAADPMVAETDPQAVGLGYKADTTKVDQANLLSILLLKNVMVAHSTKVQLVLQLVVAKFLLVSKLLVTAGAVHLRLKRNLPFCIGRGAFCFDQVIFRLVPSLSTFA